MSPSARGFQFFYYILYLSIRQITVRRHILFFLTFFIFTGVMRKEKGGKRGKKKMEERQEEREKEVGELEERTEESTEERMGGGEETEERIEDTEEGLEVTREPGSVLHSLTAKKKMPL